MLILGTNSIKDTGYTVANSCRFNDDDSPKLTRTNSSDGSLTNWTFSIWIKRAAITGSTMRILHCRNSGGTQVASIYISGGNQLNFYATDGSNEDQIGTNRLFRDPSAWMNIVTVWDSDNGTAGNRMRFFINGTEETSLATDNNPATDQESMMSKGTAASTIGLGYQSVADSDYCDMYFAEAVFLDGTAVTDATSFGEFDSDSPTIWKPKDVSGLTFGSHGWYLDFADSADLGDDESGNGNDFTETNLAATDQSSDSPTNNFATMNVLDNYYPGATFSEGNLQVQTTTSGKAWNLSTIGMSSGKWYFEAKNSATGGTHSGDNWNRIGIADRSPTAVADLGVANYQYVITQYDGSSYANNTNATYAATWSTGDIIGCAIDLDNNKIYWSKNGAWGDGSGSWDSTTFNSSTGALTIQAVASTLNGFYFVAMGDAGVNVNKTWQFNFGNPIHSISSGNADADGYGNFEYAVPSGYYALCTKNLGAYGG